MLSSLQRNNINNIKYRVTCIIVNNFESKNVYVINFMNRQTLYCSIGMMINKTSEENIIQIAA